MLSERLTSNSSENYYNVIPIPVGTAYKAGFTVTSHNSKVAEGAGNAAQELLQCDTHDENTEPGLQPQRENVVSPIAISVDRAGGDQEKM